MIWLRSALFNALFFGWTALVLTLSMPLALVPRPAIMWAARRLASRHRRPAQGDRGLALRGARRPGPAPAAGDRRLQAPVGLGHVHLLPARARPGLCDEERADGDPDLWLARAQAAHDPDRPVRRRQGLARAAAQTRKRRWPTRRQIIIFPQGTRVAPGAKAPYQAGVAALYARLSRPVVPVALNSGCYWPRRSFLKRRGKIVVEILPPIAPGLAKPAFMAALEDRIEIRDGAARGRGEGRRRLWIGLGATAGAPVGTVRWKLGINCSLRYDSIIYPNKGCGNITGT